MNSLKDVQYRLDLAKGFLKEAEEDFQLKRWRSCVSNSQLSVENAGKAVLMLFGISPKTHQPEKHLAKLIQDSGIPDDLNKLLREALPEFQVVGFEQHFMTDYGDESSYKLPWDLFTEDSATEALKAARNCTVSSETIVRHVHRARSENE